MTNARARLVRCGLTVDCGLLQITCGQYHSLAVSVKGELYGWGYNRDYELGVGDNMDRVLPQVSGCGVRRLIRNSLGHIALTAGYDDSGIPRVCFDLPLRIP